MGIIILLLAILSANWLGYRISIWIPLNLLDMIGQGFWLMVGLISLLFLTWSFKD